MDREEIFTLQKSFLEKKLISKIIEENADLRSLKLVKYEITQDDSINGFRSNIYLLKLEFNDPKTGKNVQHEIATKFMKWITGPPEMVISQFRNEAYFYGTVIPTYFKRFKTQLKAINPSNWYPRIYYTKTELIPSLGDTPQTILAMDNLLENGFEMGPRMLLNEEHLRLMTKNIAQLHSFSFALKLSDRETLEKLKSGIISASLKVEGQPPIIDVLYGTAFNRLYHIVSNRPELHEDVKFSKELENLKKHSKDPVILLEKFNEVEEPFSTILHGDYNRNNVLFRYDRSGEEDKRLIDMKMIDFQDIRYGTPAIDLAFFFYMNMTCEDREAGLFEKLLEFYHQVLIESICELLETEKSDPRFIQLSFENFQTHFRKFGFYGALICIHFTPYMMGPLDEVREMTILLEKDMFSPVLAEKALTFGGKPVADRIIRILKHASRSGFMEIFE